MWIFTNRGFLSVVADRNHKNSMMVRARFNGDIEEIFGADAPVVETPFADYRFRCTVSRTKVAEIVSKMVKAIDYDNFKSSVDNKVRAGDYMRVWSVMIAAQEREAGDE